MADSIQHFYEPLAEVYHLIFEDWGGSIARQARVINRLLGTEFGKVRLRILDCACGIGTQAIGLAQLGHEITASDVCGKAVARARMEAECRGLNLRFHVSDMTTLAEISEAEFDAVIALDNALPHLEEDALRSAVTAIRGKLRQGGVFIASLRDYDRLIVERPTVQGPAFYGGEADRRIVHQVWDWVAQDRYQVHLYITERRGAEWRAHHFAGEYRAVLSGEVTEALREAGFMGTTWRTPEESGFYQPLVIARADHL